ncbi:asparagine synthase-related protein [Streptomyces sp. SID9727]|uniref:asparagine synthase-related protein n=1 Tax=Streptomyces sp. SID9727 TaxID=2706114 RepID=UPI0031BA9F4E
MPTRATWQWPGNYAILEELAHGLVFHTDTAAALPLYAVVWQGTWAWSTSARYLGALAGAHVDTKRLACAFLAPSVPVLASGRTYFAGVEQLPPGSRIELPATGDRYVYSTTWCPDPLDGPPPHLRLRNALTAAVRLRADTDLLSEAAEDYAAAPDPLPGLDASVRILVDEIREVARTAVADAELADACGIDLHNPFLDASVVDAVLRTPVGLRPAPYAYKPVLKRAFADLLPAELVARTTKGAFEADHYGGLRAVLPQLLDTGGMNLAALGLIDAKRFREQIRHAAAGVPMPLAHIEQALAADAWLHTITHTPDPVWGALVPGKVE